jgi:hypothetical protein
MGRRAARSRAACMSVALGRPKPLTRPLGGQRAKRARGPIHARDSM